MAIRFAHSAYRHGISEDRALYVIANCPSPSYPDDPLPAGDRVMFLWADRDGVPLEVGAIELDSGDLLIVHAMRMRTVYQPEYARLLKWNRR